MTEAWNSLPEIQLFTVISIAIALTGAAYSIVVLLKEDHKEEIDTATKNAPDLLREVEGVDNKNNIEQAKKAYDEIISWEKKWKRRLRFPGYVFCVFVVVITVYVIIEMDPSQLQCKWLIFQITLGLILIIDIISLYLARKAYEKIKANKSILKSCNLTARDQQTQERLIREQQSNNQSVDEPSEESTDRTPPDSATYPKGKIG